MIRCMMFTVRQWPILTRELICTPVGTKGCGLNYGTGCQDIPLELQYQQIPPYLGSTFQPIELPQVT